MKLQVIYHLSGYFPPDYAEWKSQQKVETFFVQGSVSESTIVKMLIDENKTGHTINPELVIINEL